MRFTPNGKAVTGFSVATSRSYTKSDGQKVDETTWFRISVWGAAAEACNQYLKKGRPVLVVGRLKPDPQTGGPTVFKRNDGSSGAAFEVNASTVKFLPYRDQPAGSGGDYGDMPGKVASDEPEKEIPF
ncbi:MAG: single-stranded DNA-binding protein [Kosmotogaceae bacterium]